MTDEKSKKRILKHILESQEFKSSSTNKKLIAFLIENSIRGIETNEYSIATQIFNRNTDFNSNEDTIVRVSIHNLRKKLDAYYNKEGKHCPTQIRIPKGHYDLEYIQRSKKTLNRIQNGKALLCIVVAILIMILVIMQIKINTLKKHIGNTHHITTHHFWDDILLSSADNMMVLGDDFFFISGDPRDEIVMRKHTINNKDDLKGYESDLFNTSQIRLPSYTILPSICVYPLQYIYPMLPAQTKLPIHYASRLKPADLIDNNILFVGTFRTLYILNTIISSRIPNYVCEIGNRSLTINASDSLHTFVMQGSPDKNHTDYCYVAKIPGPNNNTMTLIVSFFETAMIGAIQFLTDPEKLKELDQLFEQKYNARPEYFDCLIQTSGYSRTAFTTSIVFFDAIKAEDIDW